jgi:biopolymer transport protein TolR
MEAPMRLGSASRTPGAGEAAVRSEINVTPLVDVCLVLLIIFMVVTPLLQKGVDVNLPETANPERMPEGQQQLDIALKVDGSIFVGQDWVPKEQLPARLKEIYAASPEKDVVIKADRRMRYHEVRDLMRMVQEAGFPGAGLEARRREAAK